MRAIVFLLHGCPAGWLGAYGNESVATPHLDQLAAEGVVFDRHISDCPEPAAARRSLTGSTPTLLESLRNKGIPTLLVRANRPENDVPDWFYAAWSEVFDARPLAEGDAPLDPLLQSLPALLDRLSETPDYLLWIEIDRLLPPWDVPLKVFEAYLLEAGDESDLEEADDGSRESETEEGDELEQSDEATLGEGQLAKDAEDPVTPWSDPPTGPFSPADPDARDWLYYSFAAVVSRLDAELGFLFDALRDRALDRTATWLVTSDFGIPLGEHEQIGLYRPWLYEELVHLPLMMRLPGGEEACRRVGGFTQPPDLPATLLDLFGCLAAGCGNSLHPLSRGKAESARPFASSFLELGEAAERAVRTAEWALLLPARVPHGESRAPQMFVKPDDRCELNDVYGHNLDRAEELKSLLPPASE